MRQLQLFPNSELDKAQADFDKDASQSSSVEISDMQGKPIVVFLFRGSGVVWAFHPDCSTTRQRARNVKGGVMFDEQTTYAAQPDYSQLDKK